MAQVSPTFSPLYRQIKDLIMQGLASGEWRPGEAIPSEAELAIRFNVSQGTVRKACLLYTSPSPRDRTRSRMPSSA